MAGERLVAEVLVEGEDDRLGRVQSLVRAFGLLDELSKSDGMTLSEIARLVGLPRSTAHRLLSTMEALRYVEFDRSTNNWSIGVQAFTVGAAFAQTRDLGQLGRSIMRSLMNELHHSVNISIREGGGMCYVGQVAATGVKQSAARPGACLSMHTTAAGKALMAHWSAPELDRFVEHHAFISRTARSITSPQQFREELSLVRQRGFAVDDEEHATGLRCVAAAVLDPYGTPRASLSISDTPLRLDGARLMELGPTLAMAANQMSVEIGAQLAF